MDKEQFSSAEKDKYMQKLLSALVDALYARFNRPPTSEEVEGFIYGDEAQRKEIWNFGIPSRDD